MRISAYKKSMNRKKGKFIRFFEFILRGGKNFRFQI